MTTTSRRFNPPHSREEILQLPAYATKKLMIEWLAYREYISDYLADGDRNGNVFYDGETWTYQERMDFHKDVIKQRLKYHPFVYPEGWFIPGEGRSIERTHITHA